MLPKGNSFFIVSCARSGSTSLATILNEAENGLCVIEPYPNLNKETRDMMDGRLKNPIVELEKTVLPRVQTAMQKVEIYCEKNVTYGPFILYLYEALECKFIFLKRDGRDVVSSLVNWHEQMFGTVYRECADPGDLSPIALESAANLPVHLDTSDYSRPRPSKNDLLYAEWEHLSRAEMCAYYWSFINELYLNQLNSLPRQVWIQIDYTEVSVDDVLQAADFCGLTGLDRNQISAMLDERINSLEYRGVTNGNYPNWKNWDSGQRRRFDRIARRAMHRLGYYKNNGTEWRPQRYGEWWCDHDGGLEWYTWMYNSRARMHREFVQFVRRRDQEGDTIESIADFGCGLGVGYSNEFADKRYIGVDISEKNIRWCRQNRSNAKHQYLCFDFVSEPLPESVDIVFSSGTIDNVYDIDACLRNMVKHARKWVYATLYRGWFPELEEHRYSWSEEHTCFYNDASPARIRECLTSLGCEDIQIRPIPTENTDIPFETLIIARKPDKGSLE